MNANSCPEQRMEGMRHPHRSHFTIANRRSRRCTPTHDHARVDHRAHAGILQALAEGDGERAEQRMLEHIEGVRAVVRAYQHARRPGGR
jgi:DNA-binding GntR family transcriptional regulator